LSDEYQSGLTGNFQANLLIGNSQAVSLARLTADASAGATVAVANLIVKNITPKVLDETVYRDNLTIIGPTFTVNHLGSVNSALSFDGQNDYLDVSDTPNWSLGNNFSFSAWIYLTNNVSFPIFQRDSAELGAPYFSIENGRLAFGKTSYSVLAGEILYPQIIGSAVLGVGSWHNVAVTVNGVGDSPTVKFYIDGVFDAAVGIPGTENYTHRGELMFGRFTQPAVKYANGKMSDLKFFNHTLTDVEVAALAANGTLQPLTVAWWKLNEDPATWLGAGQLLADSSFNNLSAAAVGQAKGTFFGKYGNAGDFDGNGDYLDAGEHNPSKFSAGDSFTLSAWFKGRDLLDSGLLDRGRYGLIVGDLCPAARLGFYIDTSETEVFNPLTVCSVTTLQPDIWYQATAVYQDDDNGAGSLYLYLNGKLEATVSGNDLSSQDVLGNLLIGRSLRVGDFNGLIDEVKIFSGAKTAVDIAHDYSADVNTTFSASGQITSANLLANYSSGVLRMTLQPAQSLNGGAIEYQVSNDGVNWYGDNSGLPTSNVWYNFSSDFTPNPATFTFASLGEKIYWRARLTSSADGKSPVIYQLRINWEDNHPPQACFTVNPVRSDSTSTVFSFYGDCSSDPDPGIINPDNSLYDLSFRWDWNNDGNFDTDWVSGIGDGFLAIHAFDSTSTTAIKLEVKDPFNATDQFVNSINEVSTESNLSGWLWSSNYGWTSLNCDNIYYGESSRLCDLDYGWKMTADHKITGWAWNDNIGWLCAGESCGEQAPDGADSFITYSTADGTVIGWAKYVLFGAGGWMQLRGNWCGEDPANDQCVHFDKVRGALYGWGWAGGQDGTILTGPGWSQFSGTMNIPWFETRYGTVYSRSNVGSAQTTMAPSNRFNASYCVFAAGSIINLTSEQNCAAVGYADLGFPTATNQYKTSLGTIDFKRLLNGQEIVNNSETVDLPATLDGKVYHFSNPNGVSIDNAITFNNAFDLASSGAGTVVIDGDLRINKNLYYEDAPVTGKIENLASVVWIVKGDIIIDPSVSNLVGLFIALGKDGVNCPDNHCGQFKTGDDTQSPRQLIIKGAIMARKLVFQRTYKVSSEPAEQIIYDGRTAVNTPFGLEDLGKGLPLFRETPSASQ